jgi:TPR repeat protein
MAKDEASDFSETYVKPNVSAYVACAKQHLAQLAQRDPSNSFESVESTLRQACGVHYDRIRDALSRTGVDKRKANKIIRDSYSSIQGQLRATYEQSTSAERERHQAAAPEVTPQQQAKESDNDRAPQSKEAPNAGDLHNGRQTATGEDDATLVRKSKSMAEEGDAKGQYLYGMAFAKGWRVPQDFVEAAKWFRKAAEQGYAKAQYDLGAMHWDGIGVRRDFIEAAQWFRKAAEQGYAKAQYNLGLAYENGQGVAQDSAQAAQWFRKAAEQAVPQAQFNLGMMYRGGRGVIQDNISAHMWWNIASANGFKDAEENRDILAKTMTPETIAEAQRRARVCMQSNYKQCD